MSSSEDEAETSTDYAVTRDMRLVAFQLATMFAADAIGADRVLPMWRAACRTGANLLAYDSCGAAANLSRDGMVRRLAVLFAISAYDADTLLRAMCRIPRVDTCDYMTLAGTLIAIFAGDLAGLLRLARLASGAAAPLERAGHRPRSIEAHRRAAIAASLRLTMRRLVEQLSPTEPADDELLFATFTETVVA